MLMSVCFLFVFVTFLIRYCLPRFAQRRMLLKIRKELFMQFGIVGEPRCQGLILLLSHDIAALRQVVRKPNPRQSCSTRSFPEFAVMFLGVIRAQCARAFASQIVVPQTTLLKGFFSPLSLSLALFLSQLCNFENFPRSRHLYFLISSHHLSKIVIIRFLCFFSLLRNKLDYEQITT